MLKTNRFNLVVSVYSDEGQRIPCFAVIYAQQSTHARLNGIYLLIKMSLQQLLGRILTGCYWFCILIWISTYTANLAAFFTVKNAEYPINSLTDLAKSTYGVGVLDSSSVYEAFKESPLETQQKIWYRMKAAGNFPQSTSQGAQWVREREKFVFINDGPALRHLANQPPCDLTTSKYHKYFTHHHHHHHHVLLLELN